jgi:glycosyltransferase involved in cell wall biosynthesis
MRIVSIVPRLFPIPGGPEKLIFNLSKTFAKLGHETYVLALEGNDPGFYKKYGFYVDYIPMPKTDHFTYILKHLTLPFVFAKLMKIKPDIVHAHDTPFILPAIIYQKFFPNCRIILSTHYFFKQNSPIINKLLFSFDMKSAPIIASVGRTMQKDTKDIYGKKSYLISLGLEIDKFKKSSTTEINATKKKYKIPLNKKIVLFLGRIVDQKGIDFAIEGIARAVVKDKDILYVLAGGGDPEYIKRLWQQIESLGIKDNVKMMGQVPEDDIIRIYSMADIFLTTTLWETMSISAMEALSCGVPVITTDAGSMKDVVLDNLNGFVIKKRDSAVLAEKILALMKNRKKFGDNARSFMEDNFGLEKVAQSYLILYERLLNGVAEK